MRVRVHQAWEEGHGPEIDLVGVGPVATAVWTERGDSPALGADPPVTDRRLRDRQKPGGAKLGHEELWILRLLIA